MRIYILLFFVTLSFHWKVFSQNTQAIEQGPVSPTAFEFLKYGEIPVSEYTGIPNISIPIYEIKEKGITIPINISYHAGGIRVNQEASEVGLGWNLQYGGSIVQIINDEDDYRTWGNGEEIEKILPDYWESPIVSLFPYRYDYPFTGIPGAGWRSPIDIPTPMHRHSFKIATDNYIPVNGRFDQQHSFLYQPNYDSEPDIFKANFLGHSFEFIRDFENGNLVILDKRGYRLERINISGSNFNWKVTAPDGNQFFFETITETKLATSYSEGDITSGAGGGNNNGLPTNKTWFLSKVITAQKQEITFTYDQTESNTNMLNFSQKFQHLTELQYEQPAIDNRERMHYDGKAINRKNGVLSSYSISSEEYTNISSITFPNGSIEFIYSTRLDINGAKKLDRIDIKNIQNTVINHYDFDYEYFVSSSGPNEFELKGSNTDIEKTHRLKLLSVTRNNELHHNFKYSNVNLPSKTSFAQDYWGFYNGQISNTSLIPNPSRLQFQFYQEDNGDNHSANIDFAKAGILEEITYPTGGKTIFEYELNRFSNYTVPNFNGTLSSYGSQGLGLRIGSITNYDGTTFVGKKIYSYGNGIAIQSKHFYVRHSVELMENNDEIFTASRRFMVDMIDGSGFYTAAPLGSINTVGYSTVTIKEEDALQNTRGRVVKTFSNTADIEAPRASNIQDYLSLPNRLSRVDEVVENGILLNEKIFNEHDFMLSEVEYNYSKRFSPLYYGIKIRPITNLYIAVVGIGPDDGPPYSSIPQHLIGYYPLYTIKSRLIKKIVSTYYENGNQPLSEEYVYTYDNLDRLVKERYYEDGIKNRIETTYTYASFTEENLINAPSAIYKKRFTNENTDGATFSNQHFSYKKYNDLNGSILLEDMWNCTRGSYPPYDDENCTNSSILTYDSLGNVLEHQTNEGMITSVIWGYQDTLPIATLQNVNYNDIPETTITNLKDLSNLDNDTCSTGNCNEKDLREALQSLQDSFPNAFVSTYTHDPMIGMTSTTDPRGYTMFYVYDQKHRLKYVKDSEDKVISENNYNYKN